MGADPKSELLWLSFRYVSGELTGDDAQDFERRLDTDQEAREAVAEAVELIGAVAAQGPAVVAIPRTPSLRRRLVTAAVALAACLLVALGLKVASHPGGPFGTRSVDDPNRDVALTWSGLRTGEDAGDADSPPVGDMMAWNGGDGGEADANGMTEALPSWVFEAATLHESSAVETKEN